MFVVVRRRTLGTVVALLILVIVVGWAVRTEREEGSSPQGGSAGEASLEEAAPEPQARPDGGTAGATVPAVASVGESAVAGKAERTASEWAVEPGRADGARSSLEPYFEARIARDRARSRRIELLTEIVLGSDAAEERKRASQDELDAILRRAEVEVVAEGIIRNQGFSNPLVFAGEESVSVVVNETLDSSGAARIGEAVARLAGVSRADVVIADGGNVAAARPR